MVARQPSVSVRQKEVHLGPQDPALGRTRKPHEHMCGGDIPAKLPQGGLRLLPVHVLYFLNTSNTRMSSGAGARMRTRRPRLAGRHARGCQEAPPAPSACWIAPKV